MIGYGRIISCMNSINLLSIRGRLLSSHQNASKNTLKFMKQSIFPPKPKKPETAFLLYIKQVRPRFIQEDPCIKSSEIVKRASKEWAELNPIEKEDFQKEYNKNYELYVQKLKEYNASITDEQKQLWNEKKREYEQTSEEGNNQRKSQMFGKPKKPLSAFLSYALSKKNEGEPNKFDWVKKAKLSWHELSKAEKEPYLSQAMQQMEQYKKDLEKWEMEMIHLGHPDIVRRLTLTKYKQVRRE